jgi:hypothetical protein
MFVDKFPSQQSARVIRYPAQPLLQCLGVLFRPRCGIILLLLFPCCLALFGLARLPVVRGFLLLPASSGLP